LAAAIAAEGNTSAVMTIAKAAIKYFMKRGKKMKITHKEKLLRLYCRTYKNCLFYKEQGDEKALLNEVGVLRGIVYCLEAIVGENNVFMEINFCSFNEMIQEQNRLRK